MLRFASLQKSNLQTYVDFAAQLERMIRGWQKPSDQLWNEPGYKKFVNGLIILRLMGITNKISLKRQIRQMTDKTAREVAQSMDDFFSVETSKLGNCFEGNSEIRRNMTSTCWKCNKPGHKVRYCRMKPITHVKDNSGLQQKRDKPSYRRPNFVKRQEGLEDSCWRCSRTMLGQECVCSQRGNASHFVKSERQRQPLNNKRRNEEEMNTSNSNSLNNTNEDPEHLKDNVPDTQEVCSTSGTSASSLPSEESKKIIDNFGEETENTQKDTTTDEKECPETEDLPEPTIKKRKEEDLNQTKTPDQPPDQPEASNHQPLKMSPKSEDQSIDMTANARLGEKPCQPSHRMSRQTPVAHHQKAKYRSPMKNQATIRPTHRRITSTTKKTKRTRQQKQARRNRTRISTFFRLPQASQANAFKARRGECRDPIHSVNIAFLTPPV